MCSLAHAALPAAAAAAGPQTDRDKEAAAPPINLRYSRDVGVLQLTVLVVTLGYAGEQAGCTSRQAGRLCAALHCIRALGAEGWGLVAPLTPPPTPRATRLPACLPVCLPAVLPACLPACLISMMPALEAAAAVLRLPLQPAPPAVVSPLILPFGLVYFLMTWPVWRYQVL